MSKQDEWEQVIAAFAGMGNTGGWIRADCPMCEEGSGSPDRRKSLGLNTATGGYNCPRCGSKGRIPDDLLDEIPYLPPTAAAAPVEKPPVQLADGYVPLYNVFGEPIQAPQLHAGRDYLTRTGGTPPGRGLPDATLAEAHMGVVLNGYLRNRIIMPIPNYQYADPWAAPWRGWVSRDYTGSPWNGKKYLYPKNMDREGLLYNEPALWEETDRPVYVVESILDTLALWPDSVAVLGKPIASQFEKICAACRPVVVALDGDAHDEGAMLAMKIRFTRTDKRVGAVKLPPRTDPGEVPRTALDDAALRSLSVWGSAIVRV